MKQVKAIKSRTGSILANIVMMLFSISCIIPVLWMFTASLKSQADFNANIISFPKDIFINNYLEIFTDSNIFTYILNSCIVTIASVAFSLIIGFFAGCFIARYQFKGASILYIFYLVGMLIPVHSQMIPTYVLLRNFDLVDTRIGLILPYISMGVPLVVFLVHSYMKNIPVELEEAACIDGCSFNQTLYKIIVPMSVPILVTAGVIQLFNNWNEFSFALTIITSDNLRTVPLGLTLIKGQFTSNYPKMMASMIITMLPVLIVYAIFSKQIIKSAVAGAIKG